MTLEVLGKYRNQILAALSPDDLLLLEPHLTPVKLEFRKWLEFPDKDIENVFFIEHGITSVVAGIHVKGEVGLVGYEGITGHAVVLGDCRSPHAAYIQVAGSGRRIRVEQLRRAMKESPTLKDILLRYIHAFLVQVSHSAVANMNATVEERLARWLLMAHDRVDGDELNLTHELLSLMLGTRRPGVTVAMQSLDRQHLVKTRRGTIIIADRAGLEERAGAFYGTPEAEYKRMIG